MISSKKHVDETLKKYNLVANKALGQNFLVEHEIASYIVDNACITDNTCVIEIGPGMGALTEFALKVAKQVKVFEIDANMVTILKDTFQENNLEINNIDFLKVDIENLIKQTKKEGYEDIVILSNLPYYITSKLLNKIDIDSVIEQLKRLTTIENADLSNDQEYKDEVDFYKNSGYSDIAAKNYAKRSIILQR